MWRSRRPLASTSTPTPTAISASTYSYYYTFSSCYRAHDLHHHRHYHQHRNRNHSNHNAGVVGTAVDRPTLSTPPPPPQRLQRRCWRYTATTHVHTSAQKLPPTYFLPSTPTNSATHSTTGSTTGSTTTNTSSDHETPDERTLALGRTIRTLQERMPTLLQTPLPTEILSPSISLHLFPSTHPHLPAVRGRVAYVAALWTTPVAWGRLPGGNTTLQVVSERMLVGERLRIRWRAASSSSSSPFSSSAVRLPDGSEGNGSSSSMEEKEKKQERGGTTAVGRGEFSGIFLFEFDDAGRVCKHVIENCEEDEGEKVPGVITVTEWLIRKAKGEPTTDGGGGGKLGGLAWQFQRKQPE